MVIIGGSISEKQCMAVTCGSYNKQGMSVMWRIISFWLIALQQNKQGIQSLSYPRFTEMPVTVNSNTLLRLSHTEQPLVSRCQVTRPLLTNS